MAKERVANNNAKNLAVQQNNNKLNALAKSSTKTQDTSEIINSHPSTNTTTTVPTTTRLITTPTISTITTTAATIAEITTTTTTTPITTTTTTTTTAEFASTTPIVATVEVTTSTTEATTITETTSLAQSTNQTNPSTTVAATSTSTISTETTTTQHTSQSSENANTKVDNNKKEKKQNNNDNEIEDEAGSNNDNEEKKTEQTKSDIDDIEEGMDNKKVSSKKKSKLGYFSKKKSKSAESDAIISTTSNKLYTSSINQQQPSYIRYRAEPNNVYNLNISGLLHDVKNSEENGTQLDGGIIDKIIKNEEKHNDKPLPIETNFDSSKDANEISEIMKLNNLKDDIANDEEELIDGNSCVFRKYGTNNKKPVRRYKVANDPIMPDLLSQPVVNVLANHNNVLRFTNKIITCKYEFYNMAGVYCDLGGRIKPLTKLVITSPSTKITISADTFEMQHLANLTRPQEHCPHVQDKLVAATKFA